MLVLLKDLKKHPNVLQKGGTPCLNSFKMIHLENDGYTSFPEFQLHCIKKLRCEWLSGGKLSALKESKNIRHTSPALHCRSEGSNSVWAQTAWSRCSSSCLWYFLHSWCWATCWDEEAQQGFGLILALHTSQGSLPLRTAALPRHTWATAVQGSSPLPC